MYVIKCTHRYNNTEGYYIKHGTAYKVDNHATNIPSIIISNNINSKSVKKFNNIEEAIGIINTIKKMLTEDNMIFSVTEI